MMFFFTDIILKLVGVEILYGLDNNIKINIYCQKALY